MFAAPDIAEVPLQIAEHDQIEQAVIIQIHPSRAGGPSAAADPRLFRHIAESAVAIVVIKLVTAVSGDIEIFIAIVVIVAHGDAHAKTHARKPGFLRDVFEGSIRFLVEEAIPILGVRLGRNDSSRSRIAQGGSIHQEDVETPVVVIVEQSYTRPHGLRQIFPGSVRSDMREVEGARAGDIDEISRAGCQAKQRCETDSQKKSMQYNIIERDAVSVLFAVLSNTG
jgi:hypothetical protein